MSIGDVAHAVLCSRRAGHEVRSRSRRIGTWSGVPGGAPNYPNGCQVCEVEVDPETGAVRIDRFFAVDDVGMMINPLICEGQIQAASPRASDRP